MRFFVGLHQPSDAKHFDAAFISVNRLVNRKGGFDVGDWIMDSGAFTQITRHGEFTMSPAEYASEIRRWRVNGNLLAAVAQDYMCEPFVTRITGKTILEHQEMTIDRYDALMANTPLVTIIPVLQGLLPMDYVRHVRMYGARLEPGIWVGVGSVCKRNSNPNQVRTVLSAIKEVRPDLRLHGFRVETHSSSPLGYLRASPYCRQHGVVICGAEARARRELLVRGGEIRSAHRSASRSAPIIRLSSGYGRSTGRTTTRKGRSSGGHKPGGAPAPPGGSQIGDGNMFRLLRYLFGAPVKPTVDAPLVKPVISAETRAKLLAVGLASAERRSALR